VLADDPGKVRVRQPAQHHLARTRAVQLNAQPGRTIARIICRQSTCAMQIASPTCSR
jgi:hypothetical protein